MDKNRNGWAGFTMPSREWNVQSWNDAYDWPQAGDEWSVAWGGVSAQWYGAVFPRVSRWLPTNRVLEIAPGRGRWTQYLLHHASEYIGVDISPTCAGFCSRRFSSYPRCVFCVNDGSSLEVVADNSIDFCFSFDALVHVELDIIGSYCKQLLNKLSPTGVAFIHHSNAHKDHDPEKPDLHWRAPSVSSDLVKQIIESNGGSVLVQEEVNWLTTYRIDCFTTFMKRNYINQPYKLLLNNQFMEEVELIKKYQSHYH